MYCEVKARCSLDWESKLEVIPLEASSSRRWLLSLSRQSWVVEDLHLKAREKGDKLSSSPKKEFGGIFAYFWVLLFLFLLFLGQTVNSPDSLNFLKLTL